MTEWFRVATEAAIMRAALRVAAVVGTLLITINYGDRIIADTLVASDYAKILLTYCVPYGVSTWSAVGATLRSRTGST